jgi:hypothetical protein
MVLVHKDVRDPQIVSDQARYDPPVQELDALGDADGGRDPLRPRQPAPFGPFCRKKPGSESDTAVAFSETKAREGPEALREILLLRFPFCTYSNTMYSWVTVDSSRLYSKQCPRALTRFWCLSLEIVSM